MGRGLKISLSILILLFSFSLIPNNSKAETNHLVINEVYYDVLKTGEKGEETTNEWIEIYNPSESFINLKGWSVGDFSSLKDKIIDDYVIGPFCFAVVTYDPSTWSYWLLPDKTIKVELNSPIGNGLNNTNDEVILYDPLDNPVDQISYGKGFVLPNVADGHSLERSPKGEENFIDQKQPSPGIGLEKVVYSKNILVNELLPHPLNGTDNEFIELYNNSSEDVDLSQWILDDGEEGSSPYFIKDGTIIKANSYLVFYKTETHLALNDDGDLARLFWPDSTLVSTCEIYNQADYDISWSRNLDNNWLFTTTPTPGAANIFTTKQEEIQNKPVIPIEEAKKQPKNDWVKVRGIVTAAPGLFGKRVMYIQDENGGIKIYFDKALWPVLKIGDWVIIYGKISTSSGEYQIKVYNFGDIMIIGHSPPPEPCKKIISEAGGFVGQLVRISGKVVKISGSTIWLDDGSGELRAYFYPATGIKKLGLKKGDWVVIIGVLSKTSAGLRLLPRSKGDIKIYKKIAQAKSEPSIVGQILGAEKAYAAGEDHRIINELQAVKSKNGLNPWGALLIIFGFASLVSLDIFARIRKKHGENN